MKKILLCLILVVINCGILFAEEITITTYYPSPYGSYNELQLFPHNPAVAACPGSTGTIYYDSIANQLFFCNGTAWTLLGGGFWAASGNDIYNTNTGNVGIGTITPNNRIQVKDLINFNDPKLSTFLGYQAGQFNQGQKNTAVGYWALAKGGSQNTALGSYALSEVTTGIDNVAIGSSALDVNTTGSGNTAVGANALLSNTTGVFNTAVGSGAQALATGFYNTSVGDVSLYASSGTSNTAIGSSALNSNTSGQRNTALGALSGYLNQIGSGNVFLGAGAGYSELGSNKLYIDNSSTATPLIYGDFNANTITINGTLSATGCGGCVSDIKFKKNIIPIESALEKILKIRGVSFSWKEEEFKDRGFPKGRHFGVIAQEVEKVLPEVVSDNPYKEKTVSYTEIVPVLIEGIKELISENEALQNRVTQLKKKLKAAK